MAVAVQLFEAREAALDVIERVRAPRVTRDLHALVARQPREDLAPHAVRLLLELGDLAGRFARLAGSRLLAQLRDLLLDLEHRLFELQPDGHVLTFAQLTRQPGTCDLSPATSPSPALTLKRRERSATRERSGFTMCSTTSDSPGWLDSTSSRPWMRSSVSSSARSSMCRTDRNCRRDHVSNHSDLR